MLSAPQPLPASGKGLVGKVGGGGVSLLFELLYWFKMLVKGFSGVGLWIYRRVPGNPGNPVDLSLRKNLVLPVLLVLL